MKIKTLSLLIACVLLLSASFDIYYTVEWYVGREESEFPLWILGDLVNSVGILGMVYFFWMFSTRVRS